MKELKSLNVFLLKYKYRLLVGLLFVTLSNVFAIYPAGLVRDSFDLLREKLLLIANLPINQRSTVAHQVIEQVAIYGLIILGMALLKGFFMFLMRQTIIVTSRLIENDLKEKIYYHYQLLDWSFYKTNRTGDLMARISEDVSRVRMYLGPAIMYIANLVSTFVLVIITMIKVNAYLTLWVLLPLPVLSYLIYKVSSTINIKSEKLQEYLSSLSSFAQESFSGIRVLKAYGMEDYWKERMNKTAEQYRLKALDLSKTDSFFTPSVASIVGLSTVIIVYVGGKLVERGQITTGNIAEFIIYVNLLIWPVTALGWVSSIIQRAAASQKRINEFLNQKPTLQDGLLIPEKPLTIRFNNVSFTYPETGITALKNITLQIPFGSTVGIIGKTGSGKSTFAHLLLRFYDPTTGSILVNEVPLPDYLIGEYRNCFGWVPQEAFLFSDTIRNNLLFGNPQATEKQMEEVCKLAQVWNNIQQFPNKLDTVVGERGITLSGGQKQRITIARALLKKPQVLVLDDCLSAVDTETESAILSNLRTIYTNQTTILISHRIATVKDADYIFVLDNGQLIEQGSPETLLTIKGLYYEMNKIQQISN